MSNCIHLKQKLNRTIYCKVKNKEIRLSECSCCEYKEYKSNGNQKEKTLQKHCKQLQRTNKMKVKSNKLAKLERDRFSLFTDDNSKCMICGSTYKLTWHEIFSGRNRQNSMKYGLCLRMCLACHQGKQEDKEFNDLYHQKGQALFEETYPDLNFIEIFGRGYK